jgi:hypothetical protein
MSQSPEPGSVERHEYTRVDEQAAPAGGWAPAPARFEQTDQVVQSSSGVERRERVVTGEAGLEHRERSFHDVAGEHRLKLVKVAQLIWLFFGIVEVLIGLRVFLKLIAANPDNGLASFVYNFSALFLAPFFGLTGSPSAGGMTLEIPSLIAMLLYGLVGWGIVRVVLPLFGRTTTSSTSTYDRQRG